LDILGATISGGIRIIGGLLLLDGDLIKKGFLYIGAQIAGGFLYTTGTFIALTQSVFFLQSFDRNLTNDEEDRLRIIFRNSIKYFNIRVVEGRQGVFSIGQSNFTLGNTIYLRDNDFGTIVHECVHIWQFQNYGSMYTAQALGAQFTHGSSAYNWENEILQKGKTSWLDFNWEAQAAFMEDVWEKGNVIVNNIPSTVKGKFFELDTLQQTFGTANVIPEFKLTNGNIYTTFAIVAIQSLRNP
jgi:hypothetical protein